MAIDGYSPITSNLYSPSVSSASQNMASGQRINQSADDPAGQAIVTAFSTQINAQDIGVQNANSGISLLQTADGASSSITSYLQRMNELAIQASNGTLNDSQRNSLNQEFQQSIQGINQVSESASFNNQSLLNGEIQSLNISLGESSSTISLPNLSSDGLSINGLDISNFSGASSALSSISSALEQIGTQRSEFGAQQNGLTSAIDNIQSQNVNAYAARSQINDSDYARSMTEQVRFNILQDSAIAMQSQNNQSKASVLQLLNS